VHGDVHAGNILVDDGMYRALLDWDDAGWGDPTTDFVQLPTRALDAALTGYRSVAALDGDDTAEQRILWDKLLGAMARLRLEPSPPVSIESPTPTGRLFDLFAAAADGDVAVARHLRR
jgi:Ser/Thr protein kinase RdoA (MazF antagonist)